MKKRLLPLLFCTALFACNKDTIIVRNPPVPVPAPVPMPYKLKYSLTDSTVYTNTPLGEFQTSTPLNATDSFLVDTTLKTIPVRFVVVRTDTFRFSDSTVLATMNKKPFGTGIATRNQTSPLLPAPTITLMGDSFRIQAQTSLIPQLTAGYIVRGTISY